MVRSHCNRSFKQALTEKDGRIFGEQFGENLRATCIIHDILEARWHKLYHGALVYQKRYDGCALIGLHCFTTFLCFELSLTCREIGA